MSHGLGDLQVSKECQVLFELFRRRPCILYVFGTDYFSNLLFLLQNFTSILTSLWRTWQGEFTEEMAEMFS